MSNDQPIKGFDFLHQVLHQNINSLEDAIKIANRNAILLKAILLFLASSVTVILGWGFPYYELIALILSGILTFLNGMDAFTDTTTKHQVLKEKLNRAKRLTLDMEIFKRDNTSISSDQFKDFKQRFDDLFEVERKSSSNSGTASAQGNSTGV